MREAEPYVGVPLSYQELDQTLISSTPSAGQLYLQRLQNTQPRGYVGELG
jgi:hypothetical protein